MNKYSLEKFFYLLLILLFAEGNAQTKLTEYVDPFIGTDGTGHTFPGAVVPYGMVQLSPDNGTSGWERCSGYHYSDKTILGFSHTHLSGTGIPDYGDILIMPGTGGVKTEPGTPEEPSSGYRSRFSHKTESAEPGYYSVVLDDYKIKAELTATRRAGFHKYTFPGSDSSYIIIDLFHGLQDRTIDASISFIDNKTIEGYRRSTGWAKDHCIYFYAEFSKPFRSYGISENKVLLKEKKSAKGTDLKGYIDFSTGTDEVVLVKVGISHTSLEDAKQNVKQEIPAWDFEKTKALASAEWEKKLSAVRIETDDKSKKTIFYTAIYHFMLAPNTMTDIDGGHMGMDGEEYKAEDFQMYTIFSLWDTFRASNPLLTVIDPQVFNDVVKSLVAKYEEGGLLPVWELASNETETMIGYHAIPVITDAYMKGFRNFDIEKAYEGMKTSAMRDRHGLTYYREMGYIPADLENESVSKTLEYAYDDWCIAQIATALGKDDDYKYFIERSKFYMNVFDPSTSLMRAKKNSAWIEPFDPFSVSGDYTEANAWQYSFFVPHDINSLVMMMGGFDNFASKLDELFNADTKMTGRVQPDITGMVGQYAHGNEPSHHVAYLYNYAGQPWKTQKIVNQIVNELYTDKRDGLSGNDDCGQMSSWYVFSSMGFYPVCPGDNKYIIGTPSFKKSIVDLGNGKTFTVAANNLSKENIYIKSAKLNGKDYPYSYITHSDIINGGELTFEMSTKPSEWGTEAGYRPVAVTDFAFTPIPYITSGDRVFKDSTIVNMTTIDGTGEIFYTLDGSEPGEENKYTGAVAVNNTLSLKAYAVENGVKSRTITANYNKLPWGRSIILNTKYNPRYPGSGALGLIDGVKGSLNFHTDAWQGYEGNNFEAVIDMGENKKISSISASFLQNTGSWIFYPEQIEYYVSADGKEFSKVYETKNSSDINTVSEQIKGFDKNLENTKARYIKVFAKNIGVCPDWHPGAGGKSWIFIDEISVE